MAPVRLDQEDIDQLSRLTPMAPLHQEACLGPARALLSLRPNLLQVGCFDTAFHSTLKPPVSRFALPRSTRERHTPLRFPWSFVRVYCGKAEGDLAGSCRQTYRRRASRQRRKPLRDASWPDLDTTMGFTPLDGVMMGTRCGAIDPGILLYLQRERGMSGNGLSSFCITSPACWVFRASQATCACFYQTVIRAQLKLSTCLHSKSRRRSAPWL